MSFILDALKKSESDRQQKSSPDISDVPTARNPSATSHGLWLLVGLLTLAVVVLLTVLLRPEPSADPASAPIAAEPTLTEPPPRERSVTPAATENPATRAETPPAVDEVKQPKPAPVAVNRSAEPATVAPTVTAAAPAPDQTETYLTFNDLRATGSLNLPDLHIDLHVYSDNPTERFVFINMNQYRENATLSEGPRLRQITKEGVVLEFVGTTFLLPRE